MISPSKPAKVPRTHFSGKMAKFVPELSPNAPAVLDCGNPLPLFHRSTGTPKQQRAGAVVRLRRRGNRAVAVRFSAVKNRAVSDRNCVAAMRGGEQRGENDPSVTQTVREGRRRELDSVGEDGRVFD
jgi:hypothetical protein